MKDFAAEIRAHLDVEQFLSQAQLMLDIHETNVERILDAMLHHLLDNDEQSGPAAFQDAKKVLFTHDSGTASTNCVILLLWVIELVFLPFQTQWCQMLTAHRSVQSHTGLTHHF